MNAKLVFSLSTCLAWSMLSVAAMTAYAVAGTTAEQQESQSWYDLAKSEADSLTEEHGETIVDLVEVFNDGIDSVRKFSAKAVEQMLNTLSDKSEAIQAAGFDTTRVYLDLGIIPGAILNIEQIDTLSEDQKKAVLEKYADDALVTFVLKTLYRAFDMEVRGYEVTAVRIHLRAIPRATAILVKT